MIGTKRPRDNICAYCDSRITSFHVNVDTSFEMCENVECAYPFNEPDVEGLIVETPYNEIRYSKKPKTQSSSSVANSKKLKASDVDNDGVESVKESSTVKVNASSLSLQKDQFNSTVKQQPLPLKDVNNITQVTPPPAPAAAQLPAGIAFPPESAAKSSSKSNSYSLKDIESLLSDVEPQETSASTIGSLSPTSPAIDTPKDVTALNWIEDLDVLFGDDMAQSKFNPLDGDTEFDSLLGI